MNISIIIPVYNAECYVERCVKSIMNQTYTDEVECIIVNDCTPDKSIDIIENILSTYHGNIHFKILHHETNQGVAQARNTGLQEAVGKYTIQLDSDDYFESDMIEKMYIKACETGADIVFSDYYLTYLDHEVYIHQVLPIDRERILGELIAGKFMGIFTRSLGNKLIARSLYTSHQITAIRGIDYNEDLLIMLSLCIVARNIVHLPFAFYHYIQYNKNSYCKKIEYKTLLDRLNANIAIENFLLNNFIKNCKKDVAFKKLSDKSYILFGTSGELQRKYISLYEDANEYISVYISETINSPYWKLAYTMGLRGNLFLFNVMRGFWQLVRNRKLLLLNVENIN